MFQNENDKFHTELKNLIAQIKTIRNLKMISEDEESIIERDDKLKKKEEEIAYLKNKLDKYENETTNLSNEENSKVRDNKQQTKWFSFCWITALGSILVFASCALILFIASICADCPYIIIPLLISGVSVLLIFAILVIAIGHQVKHILTQKKEYS